MQERRGEHRGRTYLGSRIAFNDRYATVGCLVRNLSQNGAKLIFDRPCTVPSEFDLTIHQQGTSRRARLIWRREMEAGVAFLELNASTVVSIEAVRQLKRLEAERDARAKRIAERDGQA
ncbi:MAG: PilZ domain-containing protein [Methylovirgula sp.]